MNSTCSGHVPLLLGPKILGFEDMVKRVSLILPNWRNPWVVCCFIIVKDCTELLLKLMHIVTSQFFVPHDYAPTVKSVAANAPCIDNNGSLTDQTLQNMVSNLPKKQHFPNL